jgi:hypothetical protein
VSLIAAVLAVRSACAANLLLDSEAFEKWGSFRGVTVAANVAAAPNGAQTADQIHDSTSENGAHLYSNSITADGGPYVLSCYFKAGTVRQVKLCIMDGSGSVPAYVQPSLSDGWQRISVSVKSTKVGQFLKAAIYPGKFDRDNGYIFAWGAQLESGTSPTAYLGGGGGGGSPPPTQDTTPPAVPSGLAATVSGSAIALTWNANTESDLAGYRLQRSTDGTNFAALASPTTNSYTDGSVTAGVTYWYRVAAADTTGNVSAYSGSVSAMMPLSDAPPAAPTGLTASLVSGSVNLSWDANSESDLSHYRLERSVNGTGSFGLLASPTETFYIDGSVSAGSTYYYRVCAVDVGGNVSAPSDTVSVTVPVPSPTGALNVVDFGASPARSGDDAPAIQQAFDAAAQHGNDVYFPEGYYWLSTTVYFRAGGRTVFGDGMTKSTLAGNTNGYSLLEIDRADNVGVRDLRFEGSHLNEPMNKEKAIVCASASGTLIQRVHSYGTGYVVFDGGGTNTTLEDSVCEDYGRIGCLIGTGGTVRRCRFTNRDGWRFSSEMQGVYASAGKQNIVIEDNEFINCGIYAIQLWGSQNGVWTENITIQRNTFIRCPRVLVVAAGKSGPAYRNVRFLGNAIRQAQEKSIHIGKYNGSTTNDSQLLIDGNVFEDPGPTYGIFITPWNGDAPISGIRISNNQFSAPNRSSYHGFVDVAGADDVVIENNLFRGIGHDGSTEIVSAGVYLDVGTNLSVRGNVFEHWPGAGASRVVDGIRWDTAARGTTVSENQFNGNGRVNCYGVRVTSTGSNATGSITGNTFRQSKLEANGIPASGNTFE